MLLTSFYCFWTCTVDILARMSWIPIACRIFFSRYIYQTEEKEKLQKTNTRSTKKLTLPEHETNTVHPQ